MNFRSQVIDCVLLHYSGKWHGTHSDIKKRYSLGKNAGKDFVRDCKDYASQNGMIFIFDHDLNHFVCANADTEYIERLVKRTLKNHFSQGISTRRDMATLYKEGRIGEGLINRWNAHQQDAEGIIDSLSDKS